MDLFEELESMAINATDDCNVEFEPSEEEITRWQRLFAYTYAEAAEHIKNQRSDLSRSRVSNDHWDLVSSEKEAQGYSREAYEHWIKTSGQSLPSHSEPKSIECIDIPESRGQSSYLILLEGLLDTPKSIQDAANLSELPHTVQATSEASEASETSEIRKAVFCSIDGKTKQSIEIWLSRQKSTFRPTFVKLSKAKKDLAPNSIYSTLGLESTLPQHRFSPNCITSKVLQDEYPVWYFFYGTLADAGFLSRLLSLSEAETPILVPASISGGLIKMWCGKYKALVDGANTDHVDGLAFEVASMEQEDALLIYETENYEVVRCCITMGSQTAQGLTFRIAGPL